MMMWPALSRMSDRTFCLGLRRSPFRGIAFRLLLLVVADAAAEAADDGRAHRRSSRVSLVLSMDFIV